MTLSIQFHQLTKQFGETIALWRAEEQFHPGDRISLLGHNGAGKSTLLHILATLTKPTSGTVTWHLDGEACSDVRRVRARLSFLSHEPMLYPDLTAFENLQFINRLYRRGLSDSELVGLLDQVGMSIHKDRLFRTCSRGMQQRISLARALLPEPEMLLLDEPFSGLDGEGVARMKDVFTRAHTCWLMVTHHLQHGYELANRFWIMNRGRLVHSLHKNDLSYEAYLKLCQGSKMEARSS